MLLRNGGIFQSVQLHQSDIADGKALARVNKHVFRLQIEIRIAGFVQIAHRIAQIQAQIQGLQLGDGIVLQIAPEGVLAGHQCIDIEAAALSGLELIGFPRIHTAVFGQRRHEIKLGAQILSQAAEILVCRRFVSGGARQDQRLDLGIGFRDRDMLEHKLFARLNPRAVIAFRPAAVAESLAQLHAVEQRRNLFYLRHKITPVKKRVHMLWQYRFDKNSCIYHMIFLRKKQQYLLSYSVKDGILFYGI